MNFLKYMFLVPHVKSMMYVPLNCAIIAQVYYESQSSCHLAVPRTITQLYKALTHSVLVRHMKLKNCNFEHTSMLPDNLNEEEMKMFKTLAKFAFDAYHEGNSDLFFETSESRKVTFFKEDTPKGLDHFGFMNESTEMYASKGVEQSYSFVHLSLQEYLAAWHLANNCSIEFQVAYHRLAVDGDLVYKGKDKEEEALISSLWQQRSSLVEPAIFLAGITGWNCPSEDDKNHWEVYLSHDTAYVKDPSVLLRSLYEAQNPTILPHYFLAEGRFGRSKEICIGHFGHISSSSQYIQAPYDCYALSYCLAHSSDLFNLSFGVRRNDDISLAETFVKGLDDHCKSSMPRFKELKVEFEVESEHITSKIVSWLLKAKCWSELETMKFEFHSALDSGLVQSFLQQLDNLKFLHISVESWEWLAALKSLSNHKLKGFCITNKNIPSQLSVSQSFQRFSHSFRRAVPKWTEGLLDIEFPSATVRYNVLYSLYVGVQSLLSSVCGSNQITEMKLYNISRETMTGVRGILVHCSSLATLQMKGTKLGYDGIIYVCNALRKNTSLRHLVIHDDLQLPRKRDRRRYGNTDFTSFSFINRVPLPSKTTCTDFLLELNEILKYNLTLKDINIQSGLFLPLSAGRQFDYCQWTGHGPLQHFNMGSIASGMSPNLRRSFSFSDISQPQTLVFWDRRFGYYFDVPEINFNALFSKRKANKLFPLQSFTAPDSNILHSFSDLDHRLKECLEISNLTEYLEELRETCWGVLKEVAMTI